VEVLNVKESGVLTGMPDGFRAWQSRPWIRSAHAGLLGLFLFQCSLLPAPVEVSKEYQLKAVCLWRLSQFVDWPTNAFENRESPLVIGVLGASPFGDALETVVRGETAHGRKLVVEYYRRVDQIKACHILFISEFEARRVRQILASLAGRSILTVSDIDNFTLTHNGMVRFLMEQNKIKLRIDPDAAAAAGLVLDARLLRMAEIVRKKK
jgi:preprotein translocase subunit Sec61beta